MRWRAALLGLLAAVAGAPAAAAQSEPYRDPSRPVEERARDLLGRMTVEDKFWQLFMIPGDLSDPAHDYSHGVFGLQVRGDSSAREEAEHLNAIQRYFAEHTRLGIPIIPFEEAVHGLLAPGATVFPAAIGLAATFDTSLMGRVASAIAEETRSRGIRQVLSPVVNLATDVRWGRVEETYGEDPVLASAMARAFVAPFERAGVVTTPKHLVANVAEGGRDSYPADMDDRELEELYFPPFRAAIGAGARSVMSAYNSVHGIPASQNRWLLTDVLRHQWRFGGVVISDAAATGGATVLHHTEATTASAAKDAIEAGLDVIFQSSWEQHRSWLAAFQGGTIAPAAVDTAVLHVLRLKLALGLFERPYVDQDSAARLNGSAEHRQLALEAARASIVLLANERGLLPLSRETLRRVAVIGQDAAEPRLGGYSGPGNSPVSILDAIRGTMGAGNVTYAPGPGHQADEYATVPASSLRTGSGAGAAMGVAGEYFDNNRLEGTPKVVRTDAQIAFRWTLNSPVRGLPYDWYSVRWTGVITAPPGGVHRLGVEGNDGWRLWVDGRLVVDNWRKQSFRAVLGDVDLAPGEHALRLEYFESTGNARIRLVWDYGMPRDPAAIDSAVAIARAADVAIVVAGVEEGEFRDRARLGLPGLQEELIRRVAETGKPVVVVLTAGSAVTMPWLDKVAAVVDAWYPGEEGGDAVRDVLFGAASPSGRLPITFPIAEGQLPLRYNHLPTGRGDDYVDLTGQPLFPFGFGLSYTTFAYSDLAIEPATIGPDGRARVRCRVRNTGSRAGADVVQLYLHDDLASVARPVEQLAGFARVELQPGEEREVTFPLGPGQLALLDREMRRMVEPGTFRVMVGASSKDIRLRGELVVR